MSEHIILTSQSLFPNESEARAMAEQRAVRIETIRHAIQAGEYHVSGEIVARAIINRCLYSSVQ